MINEKHTEEKQTESLNDHQVIEISDEQLEKVTGGDKIIRPGPKQ